MTTGIIIGRFQTPYLHAGHLHIIATALRENDNVIIFLGCQPKADRKNPYSQKTRSDMIAKIFPQILVVPIMDMDDDGDWNVNLDNLVDEYTARSEPTLYYSRDSFIDVYTGKHITKKVEEVEGYSATNIREQK